MPDLKTSQTFENLKRVFALEAQDGERLKYFARLAEFEGMVDVAKMLQEMAESQRIFTEGHLDFLRTACDPTSGLPLGDTGANLEAVVSSETESSQDTYPEMARTAHSEGFADIASWFETLARSKRHRLARFLEARAAVERPNHPHHHGKKSD